MNQIEAVVKELDKQEIISYITVDINDTELRIIKSEIPNWIEVGSKVTLNFKEASVCVSKKCPGTISIENKIKGKVEQIRANSSLCELTFESAIGKITALITQTALQSLELEQNDLATMLIRGIDINLEPFIDMQDYKSKLLQKTAN